MIATLRIIIDKNGAFWFLEFGRNVTMGNGHGYLRKDRPCIPACKREAYRIAKKLGLVIVNVVHND